MVDARRDLTRYRPLRRILAVALALHGLRVVSLHQVAAEHGVSTRTMRRYFEALESVGWSMPRWRYFEGVCSRTSRQ